jgi:hypothetical protein
MKLEIGDRVRLQVVQSDCFGLTGTVLEVRPSVFCGSETQRCRVDFNGRIRRVLNIHLARIDSAKKTAAA